MTTPFPCVRDWTLAVQLPSARFRGTPLAQLTAERRPGGLVQVERGTFCYTFKIRLQGRIQALRCPHMPAPHREDRLEALMRFFQAHPCPHFVPFQVYRNAAILPGFPQPFSVTGMDWVEGQALDDWFNAHLGDARALQAMADRWLALMRDLQRLGIAHGDLQHGNILVRNGAPVLVDYDTCWAPTTARWPSDEVGHPNYAHPGRTPDLYGPQMDAFSGLSIHLSLLAAARMPDLAREAAQSGQMDQLLLSRHDYLQPDASIRFQRMIAAADPEVSRRAAQLRAMCLADAASIRYDWTRCALAGAPAAGAALIPGAPAAGPVPLPGLTLQPAPAWLLRTSPALHTSVSHLHRQSSWLRRKAAVQATCTSPKRLVIPPRRSLTFLLAISILALLLQLATTYPMMVGATYLVALQRAVVHGRSSVNLPVWNTAQAAGLDAICQWYGQTLGLDIRLEEAATDPGNPLPLPPMPFRTVRLPDPSAQGALRLQATGEAELSEALSLLPRFTASEAYLLYRPITADFAGSEDRSDQDVSEATAQSGSDASVMMARLGRQLQTFADNAVNAFGQPLDSFSWQMVPALHLVRSTGADTPQADTSGLIQSTSIFTITGNPRTAVWLHVSYRFAPLSEAKQLQCLDESSRHLLQTDAHVISALYPENVRHLMPMFRHANGNMVPARRSLEACGALLAYDSRTREVHWLLDGVRRTIGIDQAVLLRGNSYCQLPAKTLLRDGSLWMPVEALRDRGG